MTYTNLVLLMWQYIRPYRVRFFVGIFFRLTSDISAIVYPLLFGMLVNTIVHTLGHIVFQDMLWILSTMLFVLVYRITAMQIAKIYIFETGERAVSDLNQYSYEHIVRLDLQWQETMQTGTKISRIDHAANAFMTLVRFIGNVLIEGIFNLVAITAVFCTISLSYAALLLVFFCTYYGFAFYFVKQRIKLRKDLQKKTEILNGIQTESVFSLFMVKVMSLYEKYAVHMEKFRIPARDASVMLLRKIRVNMAFMGIYQACFRVFFLVLTVWNIAEGRMEVGMLAAVMSYFTNISEAATELADATNEVVMAKVSFDRYHEIMSLTPRVEQMGEEKFQSSWSRLSCQDVHFSYGDREILKGISWDLERGQKLGIVGLSGAGKSTLIKILLKLYTSYRGQVTFDDVEMKDIVRSTYISHVAVVPQDAEVLQGSLRDNILFAATGPVDEEYFQKVLEASDVHSFLHHLPEGVDTLVGEKGVKLSGGERQRLGIARALIRKPDLLILDEATSHLDAAAEQRIMDNLQHILEGVTMIMIAHRLATLKSTDQIIVMEHGKVVQQGNFSTLASVEGLFQNLWNRQQQVQE